MRRKLALVLLGLWLVAGVGLGGVLLMRHVLALPTPAATNGVLRAALAQVLPPDGDRWRAMHVLYHSCPCSRRTIEHLVTRRALAGFDELVLLVDDSAAEGPYDAALVAAGYRTKLVTPAQLQLQYQIEAVPTLVAAAPNGDLAYVGGYGRRKQTRDLEDVEILRALAAHRTPDQLPVFGCPTSERLTQAIDPLGLDRKAKAR